MRNVPVARLPDLPAPYPEYPRGRETLVRCCYPLGTSPPVGGGGSTDHLSLHLLSHVIGNPSSQISIHGSGHTHSDPRKIASISSPPHTAVETPIRSMRLPFALRLQPDLAWRPHPLWVAHLVVPLGAVDPALVYGEVQVQSCGVTRRSHATDPLAGLDPVTLLDPHGAFGQVLIVGAAL